MSKPTNKTLSPYQQMIQSGIDGYMEEKSGKKPTDPNDGSTTPPSSNTARTTMSTPSKPPEDSNTADDKPKQDKDGDVVMEDDDKMVKTCKTSSTMSMDHSLKSTTSKTLKLRLNALNACV